MQVSLWCTINEPEVCTANGYVIGMFPPGKMASLQKSGLVLRNLLKAHVEASMYHGHVCVSAVLCVVPLTTGFVKLLPVANDGVFSLVSQFRVAHTQQNIRPHPHLPNPPAKGVLGAP